MTSWGDWLRFVESAVGHNLLLGKNPLHQLMSWSESRPVFGRKARESSVLVELIIPLATLMQSTAFFAKIG